MDSMAWPKVSLPKGGYGCRGARGGMRTSARKAASSSLSAPPLPYAPGTGPGTPGDVMTAEPRWDLRGGPAEVGPHHEVTARAEDLISAVRSRPSTTQPESSAASMIGAASPTEGRVRWRVAPGRAADASRFLKSVGASRAAWPPACHEPEPRCCVVGQHMTTHWDRGKR
jgi:hypothetical protein